MKIHDAPACCAGCVATVLGLKLECRRGCLSDIRGGDLTVQTAACSKYHRTAFLPFPPRE